MKKLAAFCESSHRLWRMSTSSLQMNLAYFPAPAPSFSIIYLTYSFLVPCRRTEPKLKTDPWLTRRWKQFPLHSIPYRKTRRIKFIGQREQITSTNTILSSIHLALRYLPFLLHNAAHSLELVALSKRWWRRTLMRHLFPRDAMFAEKAVKHYPHCIGNQCVHQGFLLCQKSGLRLRKCMSQCGIVQRVSG